MTIFKKYPELDQPLPRCAKMRMEFVLLLITVTAIFLFITYEIAGTAFEKGRLYDALKTSGVDTEANITNLEMRKGHVRGGNAFYYYVVEYAFKATPISGNPTSITGAVRANEDVFRSLHVGQSLPLVYDPQNPTNALLNLYGKIHATDPYVEFDADLHFTEITVLPVYILLVTFLVGFYWKEKKLIMWGTPIRVTTAEGPAFTTGGRGYPGYPVMNVEYGFEDAGGNTVTGKKMFPARGTAQSTYRNPDNLVAIYDP